MYRNSITSSLSAEFPCHVAVEEPFDPLWDDTLDFAPTPRMVNILTLMEKASSVRLRLPAAGEVNVPLPTTQEF